MREDILTLFAGEIRQVLKHVNVEENTLREIRLRVNRPLLVLAGCKEFQVCMDESLVSPDARGADEQAYIVRAEHLKETFSYISQYSYYAFAEEISRGYLTVPGGHRVGICGKAVWENGRCKAMRQISFLNVRVAHQVRGCGEGVLDYLYKDGQILPTLIVSPPGAGKTTLLRDLIRLIADGNRCGQGVNVSVVDERSELAASYQGIPQHDLGMRSDVLDRCEKAEGIMMVIRSMNPRVVAVDEIGGEADVRTISEAIHCGCAILATAHGTSMDELRGRSQLKRLIDERAFERYVFLSARRFPGEIIACLDRYGNPLMGRRVE